MRKEHITILLSTFVAASLTFLPASSVATASEWETKKETICETLEVANCAETVDYNPAPIVIEGVQYSVKDGLEHHAISGTLAGAKNRYQTKDWWPYHDMYLNWGSSWVRNQEIGYLHYRGTTQAGGNVYSGKRIIQTSLKYKQGGSVIGEAVSNAVFRNNSWQAGEVGKVWANDTFDSYAPKTQFTYDYYSVDPRLVG